VEGTELTRKQDTDRYAPRAKPESRSALIWRRLRRDMTALVSAAFLVVILALTIGAPLFAPSDPTSGDLMSRLSPPVWSGGSRAYLLGTDQQGRDVTSRLIWGGRVSLTVGFTVVLVAGVVGTLLGLVSGYAGGAVDLVVMRIVDIQSSFPGLLVALTFVMVLGPGQRNLIIALAFNGWMIHARMARSQVLTVRESAMVEALRALGCSNVQIVLGHILPNVVSPLITTYVLEVAHMIMAECTMSFLGYGIQPPQASWGLMIGEGRQYITNAQWLVTLPGLLIAGTVLALNLVGNFIRSELDPMRRGRKG
jgi:peptide/nickel transport system permease protein